MKHLLYSSCRILIDDAGAWWCNYNPLWFHITYVKPFWIRPPKI